MAELANQMPPLNISKENLRSWGALWLGTNNPETGSTKEPNRFDKQQSVNFTSLIDKTFAECLANMLGDIPIVELLPQNDLLLPQNPDCVEYGAVRIIGGVRPQNFDAAYRPDGPRVVFDSKTLNDTKSVGKNWQNMINDLATEATTVHTRFPYAIVSFIILIPEPALGKKQQADIIRTLERLGTRKSVLDQVQLAEAIALVVWNPATGEISLSIPPAGSPIRIETFSDKIYPHYLDRYKGLPPHD